MTFEQYASSTEDTHETKVVQTYGVWIRQVFSCFYPKLSKLRHIPGER